MKWLLLIGCAVAMSGCMSSLNNAQASCSARHPEFNLMWDCIKGRVASGTAGMMNNEMGIRYMAFGDSVNERYLAGQISNADAKLLLAQELSRGNADFDARYRPTVCTTRAVFGTLQTSCN